MIDLPERMDTREDAVEVAQSIRQRPDGEYPGIALNLLGHDRVVRTPRPVTSGVQIGASGTFEIRNATRNDGRPWPNSGGNPNPFGIADSGGLGDRDDLLWITVERACDVLSLGLNDIRRHRPRLLHTSSVREAA